MNKEKHAAEARRKRLKVADYPSFWDTIEVQQELQAATRRHSDACTEGTEGGCPSDPVISTERAEHGGPSDPVINIHRPSVQEYFAAEFFKIDANFSGIAAAQCGKPKRQIDEDRHILEEPVARSDDHDAGAGGQAQVDANDERATLGMADLTANLHIKHRFNDETLTKIIQFQMRERYTRFTKELREMSFMKNGSLPTASDLAESEMCRRKLKAEVHDKFGGDLNHTDLGLARLLPSDVKDFMLQQRKAFDLTSSAPKEHDPSDDDVPPDPSAPAQANLEAKAYFEPDGRWQRPSDYIAHLASEFEAGNTTLPGKKKKKKKLSRGQVLFLIGFADACNKVWQQECDDTPMEDRQEFTFLLMGQGGSGKTAIVQEIVLPAVDIIFPPEQPQGSSSIIVCSSWAQAQNISTAVHKAVSCHNATLMRVQSYRNSDMLPEAKKTALEAKLSPKRLLVIEEVSMISPALYNMLLYRFYHGRKDRWQIKQERHYVQRNWAFGRMPLKLHLGDFLQLRPTAAMSLLTDMNTLSYKTEDRNVPAEFQDAAKLFLATENCYELTTTNRFRNDEGGRELKEVIEFMRDPEPEKSDAYKRVADLWQTMLLRDVEGEVDERLREPRFQHGHMLAMFWETCAPWMFMRAERDAHALQTPVFCLQAADQSLPPMETKEAAKLLNLYNPHDTGGIHGMLLLHLGMRVRLTESICKEKGLVKDAEGIVTRIVVHPNDEDIAARAFLETTLDARVYLTEVPLGIWLRMEKYDEAPDVENIASCTNLASSDVQSLVFLEPTKTLFPFSWRQFKISRSGFPLTHAMVRTSTACQGKTYELGVLIDCAKRELGAHPTDPNDFWLHMYVMLSRATSLRDIILIRAPDKAFLLQGPPADLQKRLKMFRARVDSCSRKAVALAKELGFDKFL